MAPKQTEARYNRIKTSSTSHNFLIEISFTILRSLRREIEIMPWKLDLDMKLNLLLNFLTWSKKHAQLKGLPGIKAYLWDNTLPSR